MDEIRGKRLLIIDDESQMCYLLKLIFGGAGADVFTATSGRDGLNELVERQPDLVLLDIMMPGIDGLETCRRIRMLSGVPVIMLTVLSREEDIIRGLKAGADDYVTKPFDRELLVNRVAAALRRVSYNGRIHELSGYQDGYLTIDPFERKVMVQGEPVQLSYTEFRLLSYLLARAGKVCTNSQIIRHVWGDPAAHNSNFVHSYIWRLRSKLEQDPGTPSYLIAQEARGYQFVKHLNEMPI